MVLCCSVMVLLFGNMAVEDQPKADDLQQLKGTWLFVSGTTNGQKIKLPERAVWQFTFSTDNELLIRKTGEPDRRWGFAIGPNRSPKEIDLTIPEVKDAEKSIYKLSGDSLTLVIPSKKSQNRPSDFDAKEFIHLTLKKQKPGPADEIPAVNAPESKPVAATTRLVGQWELMVEKPAGETIPDRTE